MLCQCPKLTPLQSRLLASVSALALLALVYWSLSNPHFAYAAELPLDGCGQLRRGEDHNWHRIADGIVLDEEEEAVVPHTPRATNQVQIQANDFATAQDVDPGDVTVWHYPQSLLNAAHADKGVGLPQDPASNDTDFRHKELRRSDESIGQVQSRQQTKTIFISANVCQQPIWAGTGVQDVPPPQLTLYVATESGNKRVGLNGGSSQTNYTFDRGFVNANVSANGDWYMAVQAPQLSSNFTGSWSYNLAVSIDGFFHQAETEDPFLFRIDTDYDSALLTTQNLTNTTPGDAQYQQWMDMTPPYLMFAVNGNLTGMTGLENSFCGMQNFVNNNSQIQGKNDDLNGTNTHVEMSMITRGLANKPKQQFYITSLNSSSQYRGFLAMDGNSTASGNGVVGGGGKVWGKGANFSTKSDGNCQLLFGLSFCEEVAYAVPTNPQNETWKNFTNLQNWYDNFTQTWYTPFNYTLNQIACNTTSDARYSLAKDCTDCAAAYKTWLCAVSIPRCEDFSNQAPYLQVRNVGQTFYNNNSMLDDDFLNKNYVPMSGAPTIQGSNAFDQTFITSFATNRSRNQWIDEDIQPGPYKEVLPCEDLCYSLMQSCPASMNFACPYPGRGLEASYGRRSPNGLQCNYPGAYVIISAAGRIGSTAWPSWLASGMLMIAMVLM